MARNSMMKQLSKSSETIFEVTKVDLLLSDIYFIPISILNNARRNLFDKHAELLLKNHVRPLPRPKTMHVELTEHLNYKANVSNHSAKEFYEKQGAVVDEMAMECTIRVVLCGVTPSSRVLSLRSKYVEVTGWVDDIRPKWSSLLYKDRCF